MHLKNENAKVRILGRVGFYVSALINSSDEEDFNLYTEHLNGVIYCLGMNNNGKNITIKGNAGIATGTLSVLPASRRPKGHGRVTPHDVMPFLDQSAR